MFPFQSSLGTISKGVFTRSDSINCYQSFQKSEKCKYDNVRASFTNINVKLSKFIKYHSGRLTDLKFNMSNVNVLKCKFISPIVLCINTIKQNTCHIMPKTFTFANFSLHFFKKQFQGSIRGTLY